MQLSVKHSIGTILLALLAVASGAFFLYHSGNSEVRDLFGKPALQEGASLLDFQRTSVERIKVTSGEDEDYYHRSGRKKGQYDFGWLHKPSERRADYQKIGRLLVLLETATVVKEISSEELGKGEEIELRLNVGGKEKILPPVTLHRQLPLFTGVDPLLPTFAVTKEGRTYACTSKLAESYPIPRRTNLIDKRPFYFHPGLLAQVRYKGQNSDVVLRCPQPEADWKLMKPVPLNTDQKKVKALVERLYLLEAEKIEFMTRETSSFPYELELISMAQAIPPQTLYLSEDYMTAYNPQLEALYTFSTEKTLKDVLPQVELLRSRILLDLNLSEISSLILQSRSQSYPVTLAIQKTGNASPRWKFQTASEWELADEFLVAELLTALTKDEVEGFSLKTLNLGGEPDKSITLLMKDNTQIHFDLFREGENYHLQQRGSNQSALLSASHYQKFRTDKTSWQVKKLWNFSAIHLRGILRSIKGRPTETYSYNFNLEQWKGQIGESSVDGNFDLVTANNFLNFLESLEVEEWLPQTSPLLKELPTQPIVELIIASQRYTLEGDSLGVKNQILKILPKKSPQGDFLIQLTTERGQLKYALMKEETARRLATSIVYED